jgi:protein tyrosine/serine phosphatase
MRIFLRLSLLLFLSSCAAYTDNIHKLDESFYRSAQLEAETLRELIESNKIKSIVNLRGEAKDASWWQEEKALAEELGVDYYNVQMYSYILPERETIVELLEILENAEPPILVHCNHGANRTGIASLIYLLEIKKEPFSIAKQQLHLRYGHLPSKLDGFISRYRKGSQGRSFKQWLKEAYNN